MNAAASLFMPFAIATILISPAGCKSGRGGPVSPDEGDNEPPTKTASAIIEPKSGTTMTGTATFTVEGDEVIFKLDVTGATPGEHAVHLHEHANCEPHDATGGGGHWNPTSQDHGKWGSSSFHLGDIGNMKVGDDGRGSLTLKTNLWALGTGQMNDVFDHAVMIHQSADDFTTQPDGNAGPRAGCGVVRRR